MDLRQLAALVAVAETGTFSAAADVLHTVQSNVSTHIARLERELGVTLVDRAAGRLTEEGVAVVARARRVQAELEFLIADVASLRDEVVGRVRLGVIGTPGPWLVPPLLRAMGERHPRVEVGVLEGNTTSLLPALIAGDLDLAVVNLPVTDPEVKVDPLFDEDLVVVAPEGNALAALDRVSLVELADHELLLPPPGTSIRVDLDDAAAEAGIALKTLAELDGLRLIAEIAFQGFGPAVLPSSGVPRTGGPAWRRVEIEDPPVRRVGLAVRRRGLPSAPSRVLADCIVEVVERRAGDLLGIHVTARSRAR
jgi:LysR family hydrogen peroxide-inducible transcriptional activator